jgi:hypothetical protein
MEYPNFVLGSITVGLLTLIAWNTGSGLLPILGVIVGLGGGVAFVIAIKEDGKNMR